MSKQNLYIPAFGALAAKLEPFALPLLRVIVGLVFIFHGYGKFMAVVSGGGLGGLAGMIEGAGLPFPIVFAHMAMVTEFFGGICLVLGLFTRLWAFFGAGMMFMIVIFVRGFDTIHYAQGGFEYDLTLATVLSVVFILGAGGFSVDSKLKKTF